MNRFVSCVLLFVLLVACAPTPAMDNSSGVDSSVPDFHHIVMIIFENKGFETVIGNPLMPRFNELAQEYTLLTDYYAVRHPSRPNY